MADVVGIRFKSCGKIYDFEVQGLEVRKGDSIVVESELGLSIGNVVMDRRTIGETKKELKKALRKATDEDFKQKAENETLESDARAYCQERIMARGLPMKLICTEATLDKKRIIFYFSAESRIDFRELVKDLAARFKTRIEMRQIGVRDEAKLLGGIGVCGREICCRTFLTAFEPISIKMAKSQELVLNANKLSGVCGRLMCCLSYEYSEIADEDGLKCSARQAESGKESVADSGTVSGDDEIFLADQGWEAAPEDNSAFPESQIADYAPEDTAPYHQESAVDISASGTATPAPDAQNPQDEGRLSQRRRRRRRRKFRK